MEYSFIVILEKKFKGVNLGKYKNFKKSIN